MKTSKSRVIFLAVLALHVIRGQALATPQFTSFGPWPEATFGFSGVPNTAVAITTAAGVTLGLTANLRSDNSVLSNNGAGTFYAAPGVDSAYPQSGSGLWNFDIYTATGSTFVNDGLYRVTLLWDQDPAVDNSGPIIPLSNWGLNVQGSLSPAFGFYSDFDPNATGQYSFALVLSHNGVEVARSAIDVNVVSENVPERTSTWSLLSLGVLLLGFVTKTWNSGDSLGRVDRKDS